MFFIGKTGEKQCNLNVLPISDKFQVSTDCLDANTYIPYSTLTSWSIASGWSACANPVISDKCGYFWRFNMIIHEI